MSIESPYATGPTCDIAASGITTPPKSHGYATTELQHTIMVKLGEMLKGVRNTGNTYANRIWVDLQNWLTSIGDHRALIERVEGSGLNQRPVSDLSAHMILEDVGKKGKYVTGEINIPKEFPLSEDSILYLLTKYPFVDGWQFDGAEKEIRDLARISDTIVRNVKPCPISECTVNTGREYTWINCQSNKPFEFETSHSDGESSGTITLLGESDQLHSGKGKTYIMDTIISTMKNHRDIKHWKIISPTRMLDNQFLDLLGYNGHYDAQVSLTEDGKYCITCRYSNPSPKIQGVSSEEIPQ